MPPNRNDITICMVFVWIIFPQTLLFLEVRVDKPQRFDPFRYLQSDRYIRLLDWRSGVSENGLSKQVSLLRH